MILSIALAMLKKMKGLGELWYNISKGGITMPNLPLPHDHGQQIEKELEHMPKEEDFQTVSDIFKQLCDGSRIRIFWLLCHCEECVINLAALVGMTSPAVSHHLRQLKGSGLIVSAEMEKKSIIKPPTPSRHSFYIA